MSGYQGTCTNIGPCQNIGRNARQESVGEIKGGGGSAGRAAQGGQRREDGAGFSGVSGTSP